MNPELERLFSAVRKYQAEVLPVSKGQSGEHIKKVLLELKLPRVLGENYLEELQRKVSELSAVEWHYLGSLQSRKIPDIANLAHTVHGISRAKELEILARQTRIPHFYIQVNISHEPQKGGVEPADVERFMTIVPQLQLEKYFVGFMGVAAPLEEAGAASVTKSFASLRTLRDRLAPGKKLNMGMSSDYEIALAEGSNLLRVGTLIFGERKPA